MKQLFHYLIPIIKTRIIVLIYFEDFKILNCHSGIPEHSRRMASLVGAKEFAIQDSHSLGEESLQLIQITQKL